MNNDNDKIHKREFPYAISIIFRDRSSGIPGNRVGGSKDSANIRHSSNRPMSSSPSRMSEGKNQHRGPSYQQHGGAEGHAAGGNVGVADGVYSNKRLMHACTCLIGTTVQVSFCLAWLCCEQKADEADLQIIFK